MERDHISPAPMTSKSATVGKENLIDGDDDVLQAVILADSFDKRFRPLTTCRPRVNLMLSRAMDCQVLTVW